MALYFSTSDDVHFYAVRWNERIGVSVNWLSRTFWRPLLQLKEYSEMGMVSSDDGLCFVARWLRLHFQVDYLRRM
jgi:hypothetical protein